MDIGQQQYATPHKRIDGIEIPTPNARQPLATGGIREQRLAAITDNPMPATFQVHTQRAQTIHLPRRQQRERTLDPHHDNLFPPQHKR